MSPTFFTLTSFLLFFCRILRFCIVVPHVLRIWEGFFCPQAFFTSHSFPTFNTTRCCTNLHSRVPCEPAVLPWSCRASQLWFEIQVRPICLFESHSVQQKLLLGRFYLCVKALRNTIATYSRFETHSLIAIYIVKRISCPLNHRSS